MEILNLGFIYGHGRDSKYRPIIVINSIIYKNNSKKYSSNDWILSMVYFIEYVITNMLIPGQVENWNIICDVNNINVMFLPAEFNTLMKVLQSNYRCRLYNMFILNVSTTVYIIWRAIRNFLDPNTERKIKILKSNDFSDIFKFINKDQIEARFGGNGSNVSNYFFPPVIPSKRFLMEGQNEDQVLVNNEVYIEKIRTNPKLTISPYIFIIKDNTNDLNESVYEDCISDNKGNNNKRVNTITTIYEDCIEIQPNNNGKGKEKIEIV